MAIGAGVVSADNTLESWGDGVFGTDFTWDPGSRTIIIMHGNGLNYKFWVHDGSGVPGTISIADIDVHDDATGDLTLLIQHPDGYVGALDWEQGDLRYANGTSTVTGVKVAGLLAEPNKEVWLDRLDGSIDVGGSVARLTIYEWVSASPACIHVTGNAWINVVSACAGDIVVEGDLLPVNIYGDLSGTVDVGGAGTVAVFGNVLGTIDIAGRGTANIFGDVLDSGDNYVRFGTLGGFSCENMELSGDRDGWLTFGARVGAGNVYIYDTLRGVVRFRKPHEGLVQIGTIDGAPTGDPDMEYGGIYFEQGTVDPCYVLILDSFEQGWVFATNAGEASGRIHIYGSMGQPPESPTVARIFTGTAATAGVPTEFRWEVQVQGDIWGSADGEPVVYAPGDLERLVLCGGYLQAGATIQVDGDVALAGTGGQTIKGGWVFGEIVVGGNLYGGIGAGSIAPGGYIGIGGEVASSGTVYVMYDVSGTLEVLGDFHGHIHVQDGTIDGGRIHLYGSLYDDQAEEEIYVDGPEIPSDGAITIDYDGWDEADYWYQGATITIGGDVYDENTPLMHIWEITECRGDMNNNRWLDAEDPEALLLAIEDLDAYEEEYPGLEGSLLWHGDLDDDGGLDTDDYDILWEKYRICRADIDNDGVVGLGDLAELLGSYGLCPGDPGYNPACNLVENDPPDGCVDLADLAELLGLYGETCDCPGGLGEGGSGEDGAAPDGDGGGEDVDAVSVYIEAYDTGGYSGGGFNGEVDHFVFDMKVAVPDPNDDWVTSGAVLSGENDATFRLALIPTLPDAYATFVSAPWTTLPALPSATVVGAYLPPDPTHLFTTSAINLAWYDSVDSLNGPATVMRLVIDVSEVSGADVSEGFGSVYFSNAGPLNPSDILVAELESETGTAVFGADLFPLAGSFYVNGE